MPKKPPPPTLEQSIYDGGTVYGPYMGSGTTGLAALRTGRSATGMDRSNQ